MSPTRPAIARCLFWLGPVLAGWIVLLILSRVDSPWAIPAANRLFYVLLPLTLLALAGAWITTRRAPRHAALGCTVLGLCLVIVLVALEVPVFTHHWHWGLFRHRLLCPGFLNTPYTTDYQLDRTLEFRRRPLARWSGPAAGDLEWKWMCPPAVPRSLGFQFDASGYRNGPAMDHASVTLGGDSFVEGWFVQHDETAARRLENLLGQPVANLGVAGYGTHQVLRVLRQEVPRLRASVFVWCLFEGNDLYDDQRFETTQAYLASASAREFDERRSPRGGGAWLDRSFVASLGLLLRQASHPLFPNRIPYYGVVQPAGAAPQRLYYADYAAIPWSGWLQERLNRAHLNLLEGARWSREHNVHLLVCLVPIKFRVYRELTTFPRHSPCLDWQLWPLPELTSSFCRSNDIPFLDLTPALQAAARTGETPYAQNDSHWSPDGHARVAEVMAAELRRRGWAPE